MKKREQTLQAEIDLFSLEYAERFYRTALGLLQRWNVSHVLPSLLSWKEDTYNPESFMYYKVATLNMVVPGSYALSSVIFLEKGLSYYSAEVMRFSFQVLHREKWHQFKFSYDIEKYLLHVECDSFEDLELEFLNLVSTFNS